MLTAEEYRKRTRKTVTLPSGGEVIIRKLTEMDYLPTGELPLAFMQAVNAKDESLAEEVLKKDPGLLRRMNNAALINAVVSMKLVDKHPRECVDDEVSVQEIESTDSRFLINEINAFNGMTREAGKSIRRFPEEPEASGDAGRDGGAVREAAV